MGHPLFRGARMTVRVSYSCIQVIAWRQGGAPTYSVPAAVFLEYLPYSLLGAILKLYTHFKLCGEGDPQTVYPFQIVFWGWSSNYCTFQTVLWGWSSKYYTVQRLLWGWSPKYCTFKTFISLTKTLHKCSEFRTKYGTNLACILVYFSYAFFIRAQSRFLS